MKYVKYKEVKGVGRLYSLANDLRSLRTNGWCTQREIAFLLAHGFRYVTNADFDVPRTMRASELRKVLRAFATMRMMPP